MAGCLGDSDDTDADDDPALDDDAPGELTYSVEPTATEIDWGEEYSVTVTAEAGVDSPLEVTVVAYQLAGDTRWSNIVHTRSTWSLDDGEVRTETYDIEPPATGEITFGLFRELFDTVAADWDLLVNPPSAALGETISYYDGLEVTLDARLLDSIAFLLVDRRDQDELGVYPVRPQDGQWVEVTVTAENTSTNTDVGLPDRDDITALADGTPLARPRQTGDHVGDGRDTAYEVADETVEVREGWFEPRREEEFYDPPDELIPGATYEGRILFETGIDTTVADISARVGHRDVHATWE